MPAKQVMDRPIATATSIRPCPGLRGAGEMLAPCFCVCNAYRGALVVHLHAVHAHIALPVPVPRDDQRPGDKAPGICGQHFKIGNSWSEKFSRQITSLQARLYGLWKK